MLLLCLGFSGQVLAAKIAFVDPKIVMEKAPQADAARKELDEEFSPRDKALVNAQKRLQNLEEKLVRDRSVLGKAELQRMERDIRTKRRDIKSDQAAFRDDFNFRSNKVLGDLQKQVFEVIKSVAKSGGYDLVLTDGVLYASDNVDITEKVLAQLKARSK